MNEDRPCIAYGVNQSFTNSSSPPVNLPDDSELNFIQLNIKQEQHQMAMIRFEPLPHLPGSTIMKLYFGGKATSDLIVLDFNMLCKLKEIVNAMIYDQGRRRGKKKDRVD